MEVLIPKRLKTPGTARVTGELRVPAGWELDDALLIFRRVSPSTGSENEREAFRLSDLRIEIPAPVKVTATVRDTVTGEISDLVQYLTWQQHYEGPRTGGVVPGVQRDEITRQFNLSVPAGPISVSVGGRQVAHSSLIIDAVDGLNIELEDERVALAYVELQREGRTIPWPYEFLWDASCVHRGSACWIEWDGGRCPGARPRVWSRC